jgi:hypothetical protein
MIAPFPPIARRPGLTPRAGVVTPGARVVTFVGRVTRPPGRGTAAARVPAAPLPADEPM